MHKGRVVYFSVIICFLFVLSACRQEKKNYVNIKGAVFGTYYSVTYLHPQGDDLQEKLENLLAEFSLSLSTFDPNSVISRINQNDKTVLTDSFFENMFEVAQQVSVHTNGAFDLTVAPLVNAWGFGFGGQDRKKEPNIAEFLPYIGYKKIKLENHRLIKESDAIMLDASAIAKGYGVDVAAKFLDENACSDYMVEIGGELVCRGKNPKGKKWKIGINTATDDITNTNRELNAVVAISDIALATSGNYRQFYYLNNKKYAHTIDPRTGRPVQHNLLSATVVAPTCMLADAYATAFMVVGKDSALLLCEEVDSMECYLIYSDENGVNQNVYSSGFEQYLEEFF